jgi:adenylate kinase family enzyme
MRITEDDHLILCGPNLGGKGSLCRLLEAEIPCAETIGMSQIITAHIRKLTQSSEDAHVTRAELLKSQLRRGENVDDDTITSLWKGAVTYTDGHPLIHDGTMRTQKQAEFMLDHLLKEREESVRVLFLHCNLETALSRAKRAVTTDRGEREDDVEEIVRSRYKRYYTEQFGGIYYAAQKRLPSNSVATLGVDTLSPDEFFTQSMRLLGIGYAERLRAVC